MEPEKPREKKRTAGKKGIGGDPFEFCDVCNLNHDHGRRHKYLPSHLRALSSLLSRFRSKLSDLRFFLKNPVPLRPEHSALNRIWCVFCRLDLQELDSLFACGNAIEHMASEEHLKNLKDFLWKHGGGMDRVESFRVSESDLCKWKEDCVQLKCAPSASSEGPIGPMAGPSKDIQFEHASGHPDSLANNLLISFNSSISHNVLPLQSHTYQEYRKCLPEASGDTTAHAATMSACSPTLYTPGTVSLQNKHLQGTSSNASACNPGSQFPFIGVNRKDLATQSLTNGVGQTKFSADNGNKVMQKPTQIPLHSNDYQANVHNGGDPPWLLSSGEKDASLVDKGLILDSVSNIAAQKRKKLNPNRVGAAWAEKRRLELELEKNGEIIGKPHDDNWLPNFGRVWQAGTRKESRKEFEKEKRKSSGKDHQSDTSFIVQPYLSKRMRNGSSNGGADVVSS
ncbi:hypothetical protein J5N97_028400 [Dioscorea zingiberensis]|uniref:TITAN-like protein n=1 Tax=Dioscorea zingiberensis TaxID=325984 RepID=A0A9D5BYX3_9LILI|nr:hypothetical protein J5N97_028400 [Dioscorea zingiberensis]